MIAKLSATDMTNLFCIVLGVLVAGILFFSGRFRALSLQWLALSFLMVSLVMFVIFLFRTNLIVNLPHFYKTGGAFMLLHAPLSYLYVRTLLTEKKPDKFDLLHMLPVMAYVLDLASFFLMSADYKLEIIKNGGRHPIFNFSRGSFLPYDFRRVMIPLATFFYWTAQTVVFIRSARRGNVFLTWQNGYWFKWLVFYLVFQVALFLPIHIFFLKGQQNPFLQFSYVFALVNCAFITLALFIHPTRFKDGKQAFVFPIPENEYSGNGAEGTHPSSNGVRHNGKELAADIPVARPRHAKPLEKLTKKQISQMKYEVEVYIQRHQPYLQHGYTSQELATSLSFPLYQLSALINQEYGTNFSDFINKYRIDHALRVIKEGKNSHLNINGLAGRCGFHNRNSFTTAFKKYTGYTPSEYFKDHSN